MEENICIFISLCFLLKIAKSVFYRNSTLKITLKPINCFNQNHIYIILKFLWISVRYNNAVLSADNTGLAVLLIIDKKSFI